MSVPGTTSSVAGDRNICCSPSSAPAPPRFHRLSPHPSYARMASASPRIQFFKTAAASICIDQESKRQICGNAMRSILELHPTT